MINLFHTTLTEYGKEVYDLLTSIDDVRRRMHTGEIKFVAYMPELRHRRPVKGEPDRIEAYDVFKVIRNEEEAYTIYSENDDFDTVTYNTILKYLKDEKWNKKIV